MPNDVIGPCIDQTVLDSLGSVLAGSFLPPTLFLGWGNHLHLLLTRRH